MTKEIINRIKLIIKITLVILFIFTVILLINYKNLLFFALSSPEHSDRIYAFKDNYSSFSCIKDLVVEKYQSESLLNNNFFYDDAHILHYHAKESTVQTEEQNNSVYEITQEFEKKNRWYLNLWYYDGKYVVVKDEHNSFKFVYSMDGSKPPSEDDEWGSWKRKKRIDKHWYYFYYEYN
jgi:hypothetical protein